MENHGCKLCGRQFPSGRALGGHMRAHIAAQRAEEHALQDSPASSPGDGSSSVVLPGGESETESYWTPQLRRSTRHRDNRGEEHPELARGSSSSVSDAMAEEEVAKCLMMLSRDVWRREEPQKEKKAKRVHQCSICSRVFNSGQALGGHKRTHMMFHSPPEVAAKKEEESVKSGPPDAAEKEEESVKFGSQASFDLNETPEEGESSAASNTPR